MLEFFADTRKNVAPGNSTGIAFVDRGTERGKLRFVVSLLALQYSQPGAHHLAGIFVTPALNFLDHEAVKLAGQIDVAGRHGSGPFHGYELRV